MSRTLRVRCTRCSNVATICSSNEQAATLKTLYCQCNNPKCGHTFAMNLEFSHTITPSALDIPEAARERLKTMSHSQQRDFLGLLETSKAT